MMSATQLRCTVTLSLAVAACDRIPEVTVEFYIENDYRFSSAERAAIEVIAEAAIPEIRQLLPALPRNLVLKVFPGTDVIPETGETGSIASTDRVFWVVDPHRVEGVIAVAQRELRGTLFHELHHLVRTQTEHPTTLRQRMVAEGLATVFERDAAGMSPPWGTYPDNVREWVEELLSPSTAYTTAEWMYRHPDGRRWVGMRAGTYVADQATRRSGKSAAELVNAPAADILRLAGLD